MKTKHRVPTPAEPPKESGLPLAQLVCGLVTAMNADNIIAYAPKGRGKEGLFGCLMKNITSGGYCVASAARRCCVAGILGYAVSSFFYAANIAALGSVCAIERLWPVRQQQMFSISRVRRGVACRVSIHGHLL